ncbi:MAG: sensor histidine kinase [Flavobacteriales bacterium]|nr:sensor histidine kinase [Flavobacteriales bacterium]
MKTPRILALVILLFFQNYSQGQTAYADSIKQVLPSSHDTMKVFYLTEIGWEYMNDGQFDVADQFAADALKLAEQINYKPGLGDSYNLFGSNANMRGNQAKAIEYHEKALAVRKTLNDKRGIAASMNNIANVNNYIGNYKKSLDILQEVYELWKQAKDTVAIASTLNNIAVAHYYLGDFQKAIDFMLQCATMREIKNDPGLMNTYSNISAIYRELGSLELSEQFAQKCLDLAIHENDDHGIADGYINLGVVERERKNFTVALGYLKKGMDVFVSMNYAYGMINSYGNIARCFSDMNQMDSARYYLNQSLQLAEKTGNNTGLIDDLVMLADIDMRAKKFEAAAESLMKAESLCLSSGNKNDYLSVLKKAIEVYEAKGDYPKALDYARKQIALSDSVFAENLETKLAEMQTRFDVERIEDEKNKLEQASKISALETRQAQFMNYGLLALVLVIISLAGVIVIRLRSKQKIKLAEEITHQQKLGVQAVIEAQEEERKRIARELHDSVGQQLAVLKLNLSKSMASTQTAELLEKTITDVRSISHQMLPVTLEKFGLVPAIRELLDQSLQHSSVAFHFESHGLDQRMGEKTELALFRVCQELISNVLKHARANRLNLQLYRVRQNVVLIIEDNGTGISSTAEENAGMGLLNIKTRILNIGGELSMENATHGGLVATVRVPFAA